MSTQTPAEMPTEKKKKKKARNIRNSFHTEK